MELTTFILSRRYKGSVLPYRAFERHLVPKGTDPDAFLEEWALIVGDDRYQYLIDDVGLIGLERIDDDTAS